MALTRATSGGDIIVGVIGIDNVIAGNAGNDTITGRGRDDFLLGNQGDDALSGGAGHDTLMGGQGNDMLFGDRGNDMLSGDRGADLLFGGRGNDTFVFKAGLSDGTTDTISDFRWGGDKILIDLDAGDSYSLAEQGNEVLITILDASTGVSQFVVVSHTDIDVVTANLLIA